MSADESGDPIKVKTDPSVSLVVCDECQQALFVNGHPRNFCGHSNRGTLTGFVPAARVERLEAAITEALRYCYAMSDPPKAQRILREALQGE